MKDPRNEMLRSLQHPSPVTLEDRCKLLVELYGSIRRAADAVGIDHAYLHRMSTGEKSEPSDEVLAKLGLRKVVTRELYFMDAKQTREARS